MLGRDPSLHRNRVSNLHRGRCWNTPKAQKLAGKINETFPLIVNKKKKKVSCEFIAAADPEALFTLQINCTFHGFGLAVLWYELQEQELMRSLADISKRSGQRPQPRSVCSGLGCLKHTNLPSSTLKQRDGAVASSRAAPHELHSLQTSSGEGN